MEIFQAIILGIVQGFTEFLPISSSAHLYLAPRFLRWEDPGLAFDVALHWGTLLAVLAFFGKDYWRYAKALFKWTPHLASRQTRGHPLPQGERENIVADARLAWFLILASVPGALFGWLLEDQAATTFRNPLLQAVTLSLMGLILWFADRPARPRKSLADINWKNSLFIGFSQALAIIPGVSRSGATITAGLFSKLDRETSARFSFLLSGPIIFGAGLVALRGLTTINAALVAGFIASAISGALAIKFLLKYLASHNVNLFVWYRLALAVLIVILVVAGM